MSQVASSQSTAAAAGRVALAFAIAIAMSTATTGCAGLGPGYLMQAAQGQWAILQARRPIDEAVADARVPEAQRRALVEVAAVKRFGEARGLRATASYTEYAELPGRAAVWVVSACDPLAFRPKHWSFPLVGGFTYVGWFDRDRAEAHGAELRAQGFDAYVRGSAAFSTLGWFRDPVLSTMITDGEGAAVDLIETVLHESVHATYYVPSQSYLNESVASFVASQLTRDYLASSRGPGAPELRAFVEAEAQADRRADALHATYVALEALYASALDRDRKLAEKARLLADVRARLRLERQLDNAVLVQFRTYGVGRRGFEALRVACGGDWIRFFGALRTLDGAAFARPQREDVDELVQPLVVGGCPG